jgi:hypothetical protein
MRVKDLSVQGTPKERNVGPGSARQGGEPTTPEMTQETLHEAAEKVLASSALSRSDQLRKLLEYLVRASRGSDDSAFGELAIGSHVFHRVDFDPRVDTIVRSQMLRLRRKLDEHYRGEGAGEPFRIVFEKNKYRPLLAPNPGPPPRSLVDDLPPVTTTPRRFWFLTGLASGAVLGAVLVLAVTAWLNRPASVVYPAAVHKHPLWAGFQHQTVTCSFSTFLFFRSAQGMERDFQLNFPEELSLAPRRLKVWPAVPQWDLWTAAEDVPAFAALDRFLAVSPPRTFPARE